MRADLAPRGATLWMKATSDSIRVQANISMSKISARIVMRDEALSEVCGSRVEEVPGPTGADQGPCVSTDVVAGAMYGLTTAAYRDNGRVVVMFPTRTNPAGLSPFGVVSLDSYFDLEDEDVDYYEARVRP